MKNNKAFTLAELLGAIIVLSIIAIIIFPIVDKSLDESKEELFKVQVNKIITYASDWATKNVSSLPKNEGEIITITIGQLKQSGFLPLDIRNPKTNKLFPNDMLITIKRTINGYEYKIDLESGTEYFDENINPDAPIIILSGTHLEYIELNSLYTDKGYMAKSSIGENITDSVSVQIKEGDTEVSKIQTDDFRSYTIHYTVINNGITSKAIRTVIVRDSTPPELSIPDNVTIRPDDVNTFDLLDGVVATDNSGKNVTIKVESQLSNIIGKYVVTYIATDQSNNITTKKRIVRVEKKYVAEDLNGADPELKSGMIPIKWDGEKWIKASTAEKWYDYTNKKWANVVLVTDQTRENYINASAGTVINETDVLAYLVWIPRYKYKLFNADVPIVSEVDITKIKTIDIVFESKNTVKSNGNANGTYLTHPAFTFGTTELAGIWIGKFETTGDVVTPTIKPNITSLRNIDVATMFTTSRNMGKKVNIYGVKENEIDTHMMKNMEWGAVAYLSHSKYGINGEIRYNNSTNFITGCAATNIPTTGYTTPGYVGCENAYNTSIGQMASTTGNVTGIYDMAGGAWDYVMGVMEDSLNSNVPTSGRNSLYNSGFNGKFTCPTCESMTDLSLTNGIKFPENKYYDLYTYGTTNTDVVAYSRGKLGDATKEMTSFAVSAIEQDGQTRYISSWYNDYSHFLYSSYPWLVRGGNWASGADAGVFAFGDSAGNAISHYSFRVVFSG